MERDIPTGIRVCTKWNVKRVPIMDKNMLNHIANLNQLILMTNYGINVWTNTELHISVLFPFINKELVLLVL